MRSDRSRIRGSHGAGNDENRDLRHSRAFEQLLVGVVVSADLIIADADRGILDAVGLEADEGHLRRVMKILETAP